MKKYADFTVNSFCMAKVTFTGNAATAENFAFYLDEIKQLYAGKTKIAIIFDATTAAFPSIKYQKLQAQWFKDNELMIQTFCAGTAYMIPNVLLRNVLQTIFKYQQQPVDYLVCKTIEEAKIWTFDKLKNFDAHVI